jgi:hypothetical protein
MPETDLSTADVRRHGVVARKRTHASCTFARSVSNVIEWSGFQGCIAIQSTDEGRPRLACALSWPPFSIQATSRIIGHRVEGRQINRTWHQVTADDERRRSGQA